MAGTSLPSSLLSQGPSLLFSSSNQVSEAKCRTVVTSGKRSLVRCLAKKKISFVDQVLDYIEGGPKLLPKDGSSSGDDEEIEGMLKTKCKKLPKRVELESQDILHFSCLHLSTSFGTYEAEEEDDRDGDKDTVFVTDGDSDLGQMIILQLIVKGTRVKSLVKDKRKALEAFGAYVELTSGDASDERFLRKAFKGVGAIISPTEGFLSNVKSLKGVKHAILLSQGAAAKGSISKEDAARICIEALSVIPPTGLIFEVSNGGEAVSDWEGQLMKLMQRESQKK